MAMMKKRIATPRGNTEMKMMRTARPIASKAARTKAATTRKKLEHRM
jgi:hypothetical protein